MVVRQGQAGDRLPYADQSPKSDAAPFLRGSNLEGSRIHQRLRSLTLMRQTHKAAERAATQVSPSVSPP